MATQKIQSEDGDLYAVVKATLRVLVCREGDLWSAQGVEFDYAACGTSFDDVLARFEEGLAATIHAHIQRYQSIDGLMRYAPESEWQGMNDPTEFNVEILGVHKVEAGPLERLPFDKIAYMQRKAAA